MARRRKGVRVLGPYEHGRKWRIVLVDERGEKTVEAYETETKARQVFRSLKRELGGEQELSVSEAIDRYEQHLVGTKGNRTRSVDTTVGRLRSYFRDSEVLREVTPPRCERYYAALCERVAVDTHRNTLAEVKTFLRWCVRRGFIDRNPAEGVEPVGRRRKGKKQLRIDEARRWQERAVEYAERGQAGAVAAMTTLLLALRASEVVDRVVRDVDDGGRLLWVPDAKTEAGRRTMEVPEVLRPYLLRLTRGRDGEAPLFGKHSRDWPRHWVQRICREVGVPKVTAHGMRGLHATLAEERGVTAHVVASALGHESVSTTHEHYSQRGAVEKARQRRALAVLQGGRR